MKRSPGLLGRFERAADTLGRLVDRGVSVIDPRAAEQRTRSRIAYAQLSGYESAQPGRKRKHARNQQSGDALSRRAAGPLRDQARHLDRNHDIATGILDKLVDFTVGANGVQIEAQPRRRDGSIHREFAERLHQHWAAWSEWPEVTWTHDRAGAERLLALSWLRDGEALAQIVAGRRADGAYAHEIPLAIELIEADLLPHELDDETRNIRQGIERNGWGRPVAYHIHRGHPGDDRVRANLDTKRVPAERMTHLRFTRRIGQLRGVSVLAPVIARLQDLHEYEESERLAAKLASDIVLKYTRGEPSDWQGEYDANKEPGLIPTEGGTIVNVAPGEDINILDTKRPNVNAVPFVDGQLRRVAAGVGLSYSAVARDYNGTYSAQRQELVENWPHYHALTGIFVAQHERQVWQEFVRQEIATYGLPADVDEASVFDALYFGPPMPWIDPEKEANANLILVQACFKSSAQVMRAAGNHVESTYRQIAAEQQLRRELGIASTVEPAAASVSPAEPGTPAPGPDPTPDAPQSRNHLRLHSRGDPA